MQSFLHPQKIGRLSSFGRIRHYTPSLTFAQPTALHRAEQASDLKLHPESGVTQEKRKDIKHDHHWVEENATMSEADVKADRDAVVEELGSEKVEEEVAAYGGRGEG